MKFIRHTKEQKDTYTERLHKELMDANKPKYSIKRILSTLFVLVFFLAVAIAAYFFYQYQQLKKQFQNSPQAQQQQMQKVVGEVSKLMLLPKGETPTIATITDIKKLIGQPFFANAANGDQVLIYANAKIAILYDPKANLIINVTPITLGGQTSQAQQARIALLNGTSMQGLTNTIESQITQAYPGASIVSKEQAKNAYNTTTVISLSLQAQSAAADLAKSLNASVGTFPSGETKPANADILIIVGKDKVQ